MLGYFREYCFIRTVWNKLCFWEYIFHQKMYSKSDQWERTIPRRTGKNMLYKSDYLFIYCCKNIYMQVSEILETTAYGKRKMAEVGVSRLLSEGAYSAAFPLHEVRWWMYRAKEMLCLPLFLMPYSIYNFHISIFMYFNLMYNIPASEPLL